MLAYCWNALNISFINVFSSCSEIFNAFQQYANIKHINFTYESNFRYMNVWFDKEKMESIFKNIISNALKYTPENGNVQVFVSETTDSWSIFQCIRNDVLKNRLHFLFIKPYIHRPEITFISEVDMFDVGVLLKCIEYFIHKRV